MFSISPTVKIRFGLRSFGLLFVIWTSMSLLACVAAIPVAVHYFSTPDNYVASAEVPAKADDVYRTAIGLAERRMEEGIVKEILKKDDSARVIEVTDGVQTASLKAISLDTEKSKVVVVADVPEDREGRKKEELEEELALRIMKTVCNELGVQYTLLK